MSEISNLSLDGYSLTDTKGNLVAEINYKLDNDVAQSYANAFAFSAEMLATLEKLSADAISDFEEQYKSSVEFNNNPIVPSMGPSPVNLPQLPAWIMETLALIAKAKGEKGESS